MFRAGLVLQAPRDRGARYWFSKRRAIAGRDASVALRVAQTEPAEGVGTSRPRAQIKLQNLRDLGEIGLA